MNAAMASRLGLSWNELWFTVLTAVGIYAIMIALSRLYGPRQFSTSSSYDLAFVFGLGSVIVACSWCAPRCWVRWPGL